MLENLPFNIVDIGVITILLLSALIGLVLGFVRAGLFVGSWIGSGIATIYLLPFGKVYSRQLIEDKFLADLTAGISIFVLTLIFLFLLSSFIGGWIRKSRLNALDRSLGMLAGLAICVFLLSSSLILTENLWPKSNKPKVLIEAKSLPLIFYCADLLDRAMPKSIKTLGMTTLDDATKQTKKAMGNSIYQRLVSPETRNVPPDKPQGYGQKERGNLDRAIDLLKQ